MKQFYSEAATRWYAEQQPDQRAQIHYLTPSLTALEEVVVLAATMLMYRLLNPEPNAIDRRPVPARSWADTGRLLYETTGIYEIIVRVEP